MDSPKKKRQRRVSHKQPCAIPGCKKLAARSYDQCLSHYLGNFCIVMGCFNHARGLSKRCKIHRGLCPEDDCHGKALWPDRKCKKHTARAKCLEDGCENIGIYFKWCPGHSVRCYMVSEHRDTEDPPVADIQPECEIPVCMKCYKRFNPNPHPNISVTLLRPLKE